MRSKPGGGKPGNAVAGGGDAVDVEEGVTIPVG
mgnify:CR=1 FL=1